MAIRAQVLMTHIQTHESVRSLLTAFEKATTVRQAVGDRTKQAKLLVPMCKKSSIQKAFSKRDARLLKLADEAKIPYQTRSVGAKHGFEPATFAFSAMKRPCG